MSVSSEDTMYPERGASHEYFETCCICEDEFSSDGELTSHLVGHADEEPYRTKLQELEKNTGTTKSSGGQGQKRSFTQRSGSPEIIELDDSDDESKSKAAKTSSNFRQVSANKTPSSSSTSKPENVATYNCTTCKAVFKDGNSYREHILTHGQRFACQICNKKFANKAILRQHLHQHISEKQHECKTCHKKFTMKEMLIKHEAEHRIEQRRIEPVVTRSKQPLSK